MPKEHDAVIEGCELAAKRLGLPFNVVSPQTFAKPYQIKVNRKLWDFCIFMPDGRTLWFEVKIPPDKYRPAQRELLQEMLTFRVPCFKVASAEEFENEVSAYIEEEGISRSAIEACAAQLDKLRGMR